VIERRPNADRFYGDFTIMPDGGKTAYMSNAAESDSVF